jgi:hypothetical protein
MIFTIAVALVSIYTVGGGGPFTIFVYMISFLSLFMNPTTILVNGGLLAGFLVARRQIKSGDAFDYDSLGGIVSLDLFDESESTSKSASDNTTKVDDGTTRNLSGSSSKDTEIYSKGSGDTKIYPEDEKETEVYSSGTTPNQSDSSYCPSCGEKVSADQTFCQSCGRNLSKG